MSRQSIALAAIVVLSIPSLLYAQGTRITGISPGAARRGEVVTISGRGFGALNVSVKVGGIDAEVIAANGNQVTFRVPERAPFGPVSIAAANPGGRSDSLAFRVLEGILLPGAASARVLDAAFDMPPVGVGDADVRNGIIFTRLDLYLAAGATVGQVNAALLAVNGGIVTMLRRQPVITIAIPAPADADALLLVVNKLNSMSGVIIHAAIGRVSSPKVLPPTPAGGEIDEFFHLLPARFPAAWNASRLAIEGCGGRAVNVLVADYFSESGETSFPDEVPFFRVLGEFSASETHGYHVSTTLAAKLDGTNPTGANPFPECLTINGVGLSNTTKFQEMARIAQSFPVGKFLLNYSVGYPDVLPCLPLCTDSAVLTALDTPLERAIEAAEWKRITSDRWNDFLVGVAAGNERDKAGTRVYAGLGIAAFDSYMSVATLPDLLSFQQDAASWRPPNGSLPSLVTSDGDLGAFEQSLHALGLDEIPPADNIVLAGAGTAGVFAEQVSQWASSDSGPDVFAVGELVFTLDGFQQGTSFAAPQITGLASYLWLLSGGAHARTPAVADLATMPVSVTRRAILQNTQQGDGIQLIDAFAAALSLDAVGPPTPATAPVRLALLDVDGNDRFDEDDVSAFLASYFDENGNPNDPPVRDYGRRDLNGDGYTGGPGTARFDLDRGVGTTQFGSAGYSTVSQDIFGAVPFEEERVTDLQVLCYYAYSDLFTGDKDTRDDLLANKCTPITVDVTPPSVSLQAGAQQQFSATVHGTPNPNVTWTATGGTITSTGLFRAGSAGGEFKVRAISVVDPNAFGEATVTIVGGGLTLSIVRAASLLSFGFASDFFCPPGPTVEPANQNDSYYTQTPFGRSRDELSKPPPNVGRFHQVGPTSSATVKANCRFVSGQANSSEIVVDATASGNSVTVQAYVSSTTQFGLPAGGAAQVFVGIPADGFIDVTVNNDWAKGVSRVNGGEATIGVSNLISAGYRCDFNPGPGGTITRTCSGTTHIPVFKNISVLIQIATSANGEGTGQAVTVTYTRSQ